MLELPKKSLNFIQTTWLDAFSFMHEIVYDVNKKCAPTLKLTKIFLELYRDSYELFGSLPNCLCNSLSLRI